MASALDEPDLGLAPYRRQRVRGRGRAQQVVAALHDDAGDVFELARFAQQLVGLHEAVIGEVVRFHERRGWQAP